MLLSEPLHEELDVLALFNPESTLAGIKIHHDAPHPAIAAGQRLFDKGLITQVDGGYLTPLGQEVVRHLDSVVTILKR